MMNPFVPWTYSSQAWSPVIGCTPISTGCLNCYGASTILRWQQDARPMDPKHTGTVKRLPSGRARYTGRVRPDRNSLNIPSQWKLPRQVIVNPLTDLFHEQISAKFLRDVFRIMGDCPQHRFHILTKRPERVLMLSAQLAWTNNISLGVTVENQAAASRAGVLANIPAARRFIRCEPLVGPIPDLPLAGISWVQAGPEFGPDARRTDPAWIELLQAQCQASKVHFAISPAFAQSEIEPKATPAREHLAA